MSKLADTGDPKGLLAQLDGSGSEAEWLAVKSLHGHPNLPELLLNWYSRSPRLGARASCVYHCLRYAQSNESAFKLGVIATKDRSKVVRYRAAMLLAVAQNPAAIPSLEALSQNDQSRSDAQAAINAIRLRNPNLFVDRAGTGRATLCVS
jgi:hypothetical protein